MDELDHNPWYFRVLNWLYTWAYIFVWAQICVWEKLTGQEVSCPSCWKCTASRWAMFTIIVGSITWLITKLV